MYVITVDRVLRLITIIGETRCHPNGMLHDCPAMQL